MPHSLIRLCLAACGSSSRPHQTLFAFFFHSLHHIAFHPATRPKKLEVIFLSLFFVCNVLLLIFLLFLKFSGRCRYLCLPVYTLCLTIRIQTFPLPATRYLFFSFWFSLYVVRRIRAHIYTFKFALFHFYSLLSLLTNY